MTTKQMEYILELARTQNFNRAAENLFITQPALTYQIKKAEEEIGTSLFFRTGKGAGLTAAGERFVETIRPLLSEYSEAVEEARTLDPEYRAAIRIALPERVAILRLPEAVDAFAEQYPNIPVMPRRFSQEAYHGEELPEADMVFLPKEKHMHRYRGWQEAATLHAHRGAEELPRTQDIVADPEKPVIWVPYLATPILLSLMVKMDEKREIIHKFVRFFG
ncbi:MAG: LysR family transcriptional regulator [Lachnospiraceae bacterium]|nr:LysR family transcriptional regulator [Lachnospiraceae bacterium]